MWLWLRIKRSVSRRLCARRSVSKRISLCSLNYAKTVPYAKLANAPPCATFLGRQRTLFALFVSRVRMWPILCGVFNNVSALRGSCHCATCLGVCVFVCCAYKYIPRLCVHVAPAARYVVGRHFVAGPRLCAALLSIMNVSVVFMSARTMRVFEIMHTI